MEIQYYTKQVYGKTLEYIKDQKQAQQISALTGSKTLTPAQKSAFENLGCTFVRTFEPTK